MRAIRFSNLGIANVVLSWKCDRASIVTGVAKFDGSATALDFLLSLRPEGLFSDGGQLATTEVKEIWELRNSSGATQLNFPVEQNQVIYCSISAAKGSVYLLLEDAVT